MLISFPQTVFVRQQTTPTVSMVGSPLTHLLGTVGKLVMAMKLVQISTESVL